MQIARGERSRLATEGSPTMPQLSSPAGRSVQFVVLLGLAAALHCPPKLLAFVDKPLGIEFRGKADSLAQCRSATSRGPLCVAYGGNAKSERAVSLGLSWIAAHQLPDGGWSFNHARAPGCQGKCPNPGSLDTGRNAATAMALLPLLGAGQTHLAGKFAQGSWYTPRGDHGAQRGGRLYCTSMALLLLEVYYRYPPVSGQLTLPPRSRPGVLEVRPQS